MHQHHIQASKLTLARMHPHGHIHRQTDRHMHTNAQTYTHQKRVQFQSDPCYSITIYCCKMIYLYTGTYAYMHTYIHTCIHAYMHTYMHTFFVTEFAKTDLMGTNTEIHFLPVDESHTHALPRDTKHLRLDGQVCFFRRLFSDTVNHEGAFHGLCGPGGALIRPHGVSN